MAHFNRYLSRQGRKDAKDAKEEERGVICGIIVLLSRFIFPLPFALCVLGASAPLREELGVMLPPNTNTLSFSGLFYILDRSHLKV